MSTPAYPLVCLGNPLLDIQVNVDDAYLNKYDLKANDAILVEDKHMPIFDEVVKLDNVAYIAGGAAQNAARGAAYVLPEDSVVYFGSVAADQYMDELLKENEKAGVTSKYQVHQKDSGLATGKCAALITGQDRSLVTDLNAANHFQLEHLKKPANWEIVENAKAYYIGGFHLTVCPPAIQALVEHAAETNKVAIMNFSAPFLCQFFKDPLDAAVPYLDYVICNESEAEAYAESHDLKTKDVAEIAQHIANIEKKNTQRKRIVIITQGLEPTLVATEGASEVQKFNVVELDKSKIKDTNGAGDAFAGGFVGALVEGKSLEEAIKVGQWLAAESIQLLGPSFPYPKKSPQ